MRIVAVIGLIGVLAGCHRAEVTSEDGGAPQPDAAKCAAIAVLKDAMQCEVAPFMSGKGDEASFRKALAQIRDLAPSDARFMGGPKPWPAIVDSMLETKQYKQGCKDCHAQYLKPYRAEFGDVQIPWTNVHAP